MLRLAPSTAEIQASSPGESVEHCGGSSRGRGGNSQQSGAICTRKLSIAPRLFFRVCPSLLLWSFLLPPLIIAPQLLFCGVCQNPPRESELPCVLEKVIKNQYRLRETDCLVTEDARLEVLGKGPWFLGSSVCLAYQFSSVTQSCPTLCDPMDCSTPGLPVRHQLQEFTQTHVH